MAQPFARKKLTPNSAVHIGVAVTCHDHGPRPRVALFHHDLMPDTPSRRVEINALLRREFLDLSVFGQVLFRLVLHIVVQSHHDLLCICESSVSYIGKSRDKAKGSCFSGTAFHGEKYLLLRDVAPMDMNLSATGHELSCVMQWCGAIVT